VDRYQSVITRLANNGVQVKTWCVTALAALVALAADAGRPELLIVALAVVLTFCMLDAYYLSLERHFRQVSQQLVERVGRGEATGWTVFFKVEGPGAERDWSRIVACAKSLAISPFYVGVGALLIVGLFVTI